MTLAALLACNRARPASAPSATLPPSTLPPAGEGLGAQVPGVALSHGASDFEVQVHGISTLRTTSALLLSQAGSPSSAPPSLPPATAAASPQPAAPVRSEMREREARLAFAVDDVARADQRFQALVRSHHGEVEQDEASLGGRVNEATLVARVPDGELDSLLDEAGSVGVLVARDVRMRDVGKEYFDAQILERNLVAEIARAEDLLKSATGIADIMSIDQRLAELRTRLDQIRGQLQFVKDHVERAVVSVRFSAPRGDQDEVSPPPEVRFFPNLRGAMAFDWRGASTAYGYAGGGVSFTFPTLFGAQISRGFSVDLDVLTYAVEERPPGSATAFLLTFGTDSYSDYLGGGRRRFLDPFVGWRVGYAQTQGSGDAALGIVLGVDLLKTPAVLVPLRVEAVGLAGNAGGPHAGVVPSLGVSVAF